MVQSRLHTPFQQVRTQFSVTHWLLAVVVRLATGLVLNGEVTLSEVVHKLNLAEVGVYQACEGNSLVRVAYVAECAFNEHHVVVLNQQPRDAHAAAVQL